MRYLDGKKRDFLNVFAKRKFWCQKCAKKWAGQSRKAKKEKELYALHAKIGQLMVALVLGRSLVNRDHARFSVVRQCKLLSISRSGVYYKQIDESALNLAEMAELERAFTDMGMRQMRSYLALHDYSRHQTCAVPDASHGLDAGVSESVSVQI